MLQELKQSLSKQQWQIFELNRILNYWKKEKSGSDYPAGMTIGECEMEGMGLTEQDIDEINFDHLKQDAKDGEMAGDTDPEMAF